MLQNLKTVSNIKQEFTFDMFDENANKISTTVVMDIETNNPHFNEIFNLKDFSDLLKGNKLLSSLEKMLESKSINSHKVYVKYSQIKNGRDVKLLPLRSEISSLKLIELNGDEENKSKVLNVINNLNLLQDNFNLNKFMPVKEQLYLLSQNKLPVLFNENRHFMFDNSGNYVKTPTSLEFSYWNFKDENNSKERMEEVLKIIKNSDCLVVSENIYRIPSYNQRNEELDYEEHGLFVHIVLSDEMVEKLNNAIAEIQVKKAKTLYDEDEDEETVLFDEKQFIRQQFIKLLK